VAERDFQRDETVCRQGNEIDRWWQRRNRDEDVVGEREGRRAARAGRGERDRVESCVSIGIDGISVRTELSVAEVPSVIGGAGTQVCEGYDERSRPGTRGGQESYCWRRVHDSDVIGSGEDIGAAGTYGRESDRVDAGRGVEV